MAGSYRDLAHAGTSAPTPNWTFFSGSTAGGAKLHLQNDVDLERIIALIRRYGDRPMDLADASLVLASEQLGMVQIISIDQDFDIYRSAGKKRFENLFYA